MLWGLIGCEYDKDRFCSGNFDLMFYPHGTYIVRRKIFGQLEDITTGETFPEMKILSKNGTTTYHFSKINKRLYALLEEQMSEQDVKQYYKDVTTNYDIIKKRQKRLSEIIREEEKFWNPIPEKSKEKTPTSTKQYVKMIKQMREQ